MIAHCDGQQVIGSVFTHPDALFGCLRAEEGVTPCSRTVFDGSPRRGRLRAGVKRALDIIIALICLGILGPIMAICALMILATSPGPVIFRQERVGKSGVPFIINKFRSMHFRADDGIHREHVARLIDNDGENAYGPDSSGGWTALKADPRITRVGQVMRRTKLDELPQLFNVLKGDLSLVGPRPPLDYEVKKYQAWHLRRILHVRPGITGLWQVEGDESTTFNDMVRMDLRYVENWSLLLDLKILVRTAGVVIERTLEPFAGDGRGVRLRMSGWMRLPPKWRRRTDP